MTPETDKPTDAESTPSVAKGTPPKQAARKASIPNLALNRFKVISAVFLLLVSLSMGFLGGWLGASSHNHQAQISNETRSQIISGESDLIGEVAKTTGESVVSVNVTSVSTRTDYFGLGRQVQQASAGTGIILNSDGVIITNRHVVPAGVTEVSVTLSDGTELKDVEVIGRTTETDSLDVAFLKVKDKGDKTLKPAKIGDSSKMEVGDKVVAIGNALGMFQNTVTSGIISGYGRSVEAGDETSSETLQNLFQTDAAINEGNSGGPLVNMAGEVIGINTAVAAGSAENIGFAIPINDVKGLMSSVLETGKFERPYLGVRYLSLTDDLAKQYNLDVKRGAFIIPSEGGSPSVLSGSPAAKAGLKEKDVITKVNNDAIDDKNSLVSVIGRHKVGEEVTLTVRRDGKDQQIKVTLEAQH